MARKKKKKRWKDSKDKCWWEQSEREKVKDTRRWCNWRKGGPWEVGESRKCLERRGEFPILGDEASSGGSLTVEEHLKVCDRKLRDKWFMKGWTHLYFEINRKFEDGGRGGLPIWLTYTFLRWVLLPVAFLQMDHKPALEGKDEGLSVGGKQAGLEEMYPGRYGLIKDSCFAKTCNWCHSHFWKHDFHMQIQFLVLWIMVNGKVPPKLDQNDRADQAFGFPMQIMISIFIF